MKRLILALGLATLPFAALAGPNDTNQIVGFTGLGDGGQAYVNPGHHTTDGEGTLDLYTGTDPATFGTVTFLLTSSNAGYTQPCVFSYAASLMGPPTFWPLLSQIGWLASNPVTGDATMYFRAPEGLAPNSWYTAKFECEPKVKNPSQNTAQK